MKKLISRLLSVGMLLMGFWMTSNLVIPVLAQDNLQVESNDTHQLQHPVSLYFFQSQSCPHCGQEKIFLGYLKRKYGDQLQVYSFEVSDQVNANLLKAVSLDLGFTIRGVPITIIGDRIVAGYSTHQVSGSKIESIILDCAQTECPDLLITLTDQETLEQAQNQMDRILAEIKPQIDKLARENGLINVAEEPPESTQVSLPMIGEVDSRQISLPLFTVLVGVLDGFNPCAMWALLFLISLLLGMADRKRMWLLGSVFIFTSGFAYFLFMIAWLNFFLFIGYIIWIRLAIAMLALAAGAYNLYDWYQNRGACKVTGSQDKQQIFQKLKLIAKQQRLIIALTGIVMLAFAVNLVELICSAGLPAVYTQVLALNHLPTWQYYGYLLIYIFFFMLDDVLVFGGAMITLRATNFDSKYGEYSKIIGGILMLIIGLLLMFRPEWLMFG